MNSLLAPFSVKNSILLLAGILLISACQTEKDQFTTNILPLPEKIDFNFHIKPILSDRCYACHGPDDNKREASLRLDTEAGAFGELKESKGKFPIKAGSLKASEVHLRIHHEDPELQMPPPSSNLVLTDREIALIDKWIEQGAEWQDHWAFIPPKWRETPEVSNNAWGENLIDPWVLKNIEANGLSAEDEANEERLLRRVFLDLTGLPPDIKDIDTYITNRHPDKYEHLVDSLLNTKAYAERMAMEWMDVARYADSHGMHADGWRNMWPWRDWVIKAFDQNMPYDQFLLWQLAGDMIPDANNEQILATAFHRNHPMTAEGGVVDEEFRLEYVFDRVNTTATAFQGLTMECARCHDHKFDPISQKEYFQMAAFFNNVKELGMTGDDGNYGPILLWPDNEKELELKRINTALDSERAKLSLNKEQIQAQKAVLRKLNPQASQKNNMLYLPMDRIVQRGKEQWIDGKSFAKGNDPIELVPGVKRKAIRFDGDYEIISLEKEGNFEFTESFSVSLWVNPDGKRPTQVLAGNAGNKNNFWRGWDFYLDEHNRLNLRLIHALPHNYLHIRTTDSIKTQNWTHVAFTYDGTGFASGGELFIEGRSEHIETVFDQLSKSIYPVRNGDHKPEQRALRLAKSYRAFTGENGILVGALDEFYLFNRQLTEDEIALLGEFPSKPVSPKSLSIATNLSSIKENIRALQTKRMSILEGIPEVMVMKEMGESRDTYILERGMYDNPTDKVLPGIPSSVGQYDQQFPLNREGLSKWLISKDNPLTARVVINRYWQMIFGKGLVNTPQDFGNQGALPTHPELLDNLSVWFMNNGWDVKALMKTIVMSRTFRQSSHCSEEKRAIDPGNELLARGPSFRMSAEMIRDNALAASGLLNRAIGGSSVKPYQPPGLWIDKGNFSHVLLRYKPDSGAKLYRRSMYTFVKRTSPHPAMVAFDAPDRSICIVKRENTSTPLQSLVLMNDPQFFEAARVLGNRMFRSSNVIEEQLINGFRWVSGRKPSKQESIVFKELYQDYFDQYNQDKEAAEKVLSIGAFTQPEDIPLPNAAAFAMVANTMLNHDEAYTKR